MSKVEAIYDQLAIEAALEKVAHGQISDYTANYYNACLQDDPETMKGVTLAEFAASTSNWNPGKSGIGQKAQMILLTKKYPNIKKLAAAGKKSISLYQDNSSLLVKRGSKSNITGVKSFDAILEEAIRTILFMLKTVDIGSFSVSEGGGHQDNVEAEIERMIEVVKNNDLYYAGKRAEVIIVIDGRTSSSIIAKCQPLLRGTNNISITDSEGI